MSSLEPHSAGSGQPGSLLKLLPGPSRKREESPYLYRLVYRNPQAGGIGCRMMWQVEGGRATYQIVLEVDEKGSSRFHCTCADAVFRAEGEGRFCKHIRGLLEFGLTGPVERLEPRARLGA